MSQYFRVRNLLQALNANAIRAIISSSSGQGLDRGRRTGVVDTSVQCKCKVPSWHRTFLAVKVAPLAQKVAARVAKGTNIGEGRWQSLTMVYSTYTCVYGIVVTWYIACVVVNMNTSGRRWQLSWLRWRDCLHLVNSQLHANT